MFLRLTAPVHSPAPRLTLNREACLFSLLAALLAGCATGPQGNRAQAPDWESEDVVTVPLQPLPSAAPATPAPVVAPPAAFVQTNRPVETWIQLNRWCQENGLSAPCPVGTTAAPAYALATTGGVFMVRAGSQLAQWDGLEVRLGFAPQMINGQPWVHALDLKKTLEPLVKGSGLDFVRSNLTIVIDPGHGGEDSGTRNVLGYGYEKDFTLDWARRLAALLATNGCQVLLTRTRDTDLSLANRIAFAEAHKASVFVSLHFNSAAPDEHQAGLETYCLTPTGMPSSVTRGFGDDPAMAFPNNAFDAQNLRVALQVHRALLQVNGRLDRGVRRARYLGVLRGQNRPAILVEGGYLSNPTEARRIASPLYRQRLAEAVATALGRPEISGPKLEAGSRDPEGGGQRPEVVSRKSMP